MHMALHELLPDNLDRGPAHRRDEVLGAHEVTRSISRSWASFSAASARNTSF